MSCDPTEPGLLPGWLQPLAEAATRAAPDELTLPSRPPSGAGRASAVLILLGEGPDGPDVLLIERGAAVNSHAGQPAFPGGTIEPGDHGPAAAALREATEETGLDPDGVDVVATLPDLWIDRTGFRVTPVLAWWRSPTVVAPTDPGEVAAVTRVPMVGLAAPEHRLRLRHPSGHVGPAFRGGGMLIWGFTAAVLDWLLRLGGWERAWSQEIVEEPFPEP